MTALRSGPEARQRVADRLRAERTARRADLVRRLRERYVSEPDRDYAEALWGDMLREMGEL